jgi:transposase
VVHYVDLPVYGTPMSLAWKKHRMHCVNRGCTKRSWVLEDHRIAAKSCLLTTRAAKWATRQVGGGRTVSEVAAELSCDWHTVNDAVTTYGEALLVADRKRLNQTSAIGLDETSFVRLGTKKHTSYATTVADVEHHQIIDILPTRTYTDVAGWIDAQPAAWKERIRYGALDMSTTYAAVYSVVLPQADQVVDPFHLIALANRCLDAIRRRVQSEQTGHRGRRDDPLYRARRVLLMGEEKLDADAAERLWSLLSLGDPDGEVAIAYRIKERVRDFYKTRGRHLARSMLDELVTHCSKRAMPPEVQRLGKTIKRWFDKIVNFHLARVSNGPTESLNNLIKAHQADRLRVHQLRQLPHPSVALRRPAQLARAGLHRGPMRRVTPPQSEEPKNRYPPGSLERKTGFEPATLTLARWWDAFIERSQVHLPAVLATQFPPRPPNPSL